MSDLCHFIYFQNLIIAMLIAVLLIGICCKNVGKYRKIKLIFFNLIKTLLVCKVFIK